MAANGSLLLTFDIYEGDRLVRRESIDAESVARRWPAEHAPTRSVRSRPSRPTRLMAGSILVGSPPPARTANAMFSATVIVSTSMKCW